MGDQHQRLSGAGAQQMLKEVRFGLAVHRTGRLVEQEHLRPAEQAACQGHQLTLAPRQTFAHLANRQMNTQWMTGRHLIQAGQAEHMEKLLSTGLRAADQDVLTQGAIEQPRLLAHITDRRTPIGRIDLVDRQAIAEHLPFYRGIEARHYPQQRRLAAADTPENGHSLACRDIQADVSQHWRLGLKWRSRVSEADALERQLATQRRPRQVLMTCVTLHRQGHQPVQRLQRRLGLLKTHRQANHLAQRSGCPPSQHDRRDHGPHGQFPRRDQVNPTDDQHHRLHLLEKRHDACRQARQTARLHGRRRRQCTEVIPPALHMRLPPDRLKRFQALDGLDQHPLLERRLTQVFAHRPGQWPLNNQAHQDNQGDQQRRYPAQRSTHQKDHGDEHQYERQVGNRRQRGRRCKVAHRFEFTQLIGERTGRRGTVLHLDRHGLAKQQRAEHQVGLLARHIQQMGTHITRHGLEDHRHDHANGQGP